jgi:hypothetical protein
MAHGFRGCGEKCSLTERTAQRYMRLAKNRVTIEAKIKSDSLSDLTINGALALLTVPRDRLDDGIVKSVVAALDASDDVAEALRSTTEIARRKVILEAAERNLNVIREIIERHPVPHRDGPHPLDDVWSELKGDLDRSSIAYAEAVESNDYDRAFALCEWLHGWTAEMRSLAEAWTHNA